jgi:hypothetical protein
VDEKGKPTAVILNIETYQKMLSLIREKSDRKELKLLAKSRYFRKLVREGLREIKERKVNPWKDVWDKL